MGPMRVWMGILVACVASPVIADEPPSYRAGAESFASDMAMRHGFDRDEVATLLARASYSQAIVDAMRRPYEGKPWHQYRSIFLTRARIRGGVSFWRANRELLERARATFGIPPEIIVAVIGVETGYGANLGHHRVIDALTTLGFSYPERSDFFSKELEELLLLSREESIDPLTIKGSYAGAVGLSQFIPSSYRAYAVDFDRDGRRDLWGSAADAIGSVGSYLQQHGWRAGEPVALEAELTRALPKEILPAEKIPEQPDRSLGALRAAGISTSEDLPASTRVTLLRLDAPDPEYWLGLENFYVITRYNHSNLYAMAVYQLGGEIRAALAAEDAGQRARAQ